MTVPQWNPAQQYYPPVIGPDPEWMAQYFTQLVLPGAAVATKLPPPENMQATLQNFVRIESADLSPIMTEFGTAYHVSWLTHCYDPNEIVAMNNTRTFIAQAMSVAGQTISGWFIKSVVSVVGGRRLADPLVPENIVRYRTAVIWEVPGQAPQVV